MLTCSLKTSFASNTSHSSRLVAYTFLDIFFPYAFLGEYANSLDEANEIFCKLYDEKLVKGNVKEAKFNSYGICICTDF